MTEDELRDLYDIGDELIGALNVVIDKVNCDPRLGEMNYDKNWNRDQCIDAFGMHLRDIGMVEKA